MTTDRFRVSFEVNVPDGRSRMLDWDWPSIIDVDDDTDSVDWTTFTVEAVTGERVLPETHDDHFAARGQLFAAGQTVISHDGTERGLTTGTTSTCRMSGCLGITVTTKWEDGSITRPCSKGLTWDDNENAWRIA